MHLSLLFLYIYVSIFIYVYVFIFIIYIYIIYALYIYMKSFKHLRCIRRLGIKTLDSHLFPRSLGFHICKAKESIHDRACTVSIAGNTNFCTLEFGPVLVCVGGSQFFIPRLVDTTLGVTVTLPNKQWAATAWVLQKNQLHWMALISKTTGFDLMWIRISIISIGTYRIY